MKNMIHIRNSVIIVLSVTIVFMTIGFTLLAVKLKQLTNIEHSYNVSFTSIKKTSSIKGSNIEAVGNTNIVNNGKEIDMAFTMNAVHDELVYIAKIKNKGNIPSKIVDIMESPNYKIDKFNNLIAPVSITLSDIKGKTLLPKEEIDLKIVLYYNPTTKEVGKRTFEYKIGLITESIES